MGRELKPEQITAAEIVVLSRLVGDYSQALKNVADRMAESNVDSFQLRHIQKGQLAVKNLGEFTAMVDACLREHMYAIVFPKPYTRAKPLKLSVAEKLQHADEVVADLKKKKPKPE